MTPARRRKRLRRDESFLGVHFDFHAGPDCKHVGRGVTREMIRRIVLKVEPDYVQCDCKGHPGLSSYPTKVGHPAPGFDGDPLRLWRDVTAARGVAFYVHYSGVQDAEAVRRHKSWGRVGPDGKRDGRNTSVFGPYADELLIPQLVELAEHYGVDGAWVDGECWSTEPDFGRRVTAAFRKATGVRKQPHGPGDPYWQEFLEFCREGFRAYLRHYVDAVHERAPSFQVASNWAFSSMMPEPVSADVDFLSGDFTPTDSVNSARLEARCLAGQGKPWDLMAWGFAGGFKERAWSTKTAPQLEQEAAVVLSLGGGFQAYFRQKRDGSIHEWEMDIMAEVARFCRDRQPWCHKAQLVPQVALVYSGAAYYRMPTADLFRPWSGQLVPMRGVLQTLLALGQSVEITMEHHLAGRMAEYPLIVVPEWDYLDDAFRAGLLDYVREGGNLLVIGPRAAALFADALGVAFAGDPEERREQWLEHGGMLACAPSLSAAVEPGEGVRPVGRLFAENDVTGPSSPAATVREFGKGRIAGVYLNMGERLTTASTSTARGLLGALVHDLFPSPIVRVEGSDTVDVTVTRIHRKLAVNLTNAAGPHADPNVHVFDHVPPQGPLVVHIRTGKRPERVALQPGTRHMTFQFSDETVHLDLPRLDIHETIVMT